MSGLYDRGVVRPLRSSDTLAALALLRGRPLQTVFLEYVVRAGGLGLLPGLLGYTRGDELDGMLLVAGAGSTALEVCAPEAFEPLARAASRLPIRPLHIVGPEDVTEPFWQAYRRYSPDVIWSRREPFYLLSRLPEESETDEAVRVAPARESELDEVVENSAQQYREDLKVDRYGEDAQAFRERHGVDVRDGRWWVLRSGGRIVFQLHVGAHNDSAVQLGGVFTRPDLRRKGIATAGMRATCKELLRRHPAVSLFCDEDNEPARALYERLGFRTVFHYRSYLLRG